ncbi:hypothetical protein [Aeromicrobium sp.]|uniref:hypothetical protein n=1 Tax=Aeromicrobium sp. TaxID=1871063 RepID=UPI002FC9F570
MDKARTAYAESKPLVSNLEDKLDSVQAKAERRQLVIDQQQAIVDRERNVAATLRTEHIEDREKAAQKIGLIKSENRAEQDEYVSARLGMVYLAALTGGFLLIGFVKAIAVAIVGGWRIIALLAGIVGSLALLGIAIGTGSFGVGLLPAILGGSLFSSTLMLARIWWLAKILPKAIAFGAIGIAAIFAAFAVGTAATLAAPVSETPAPADTALVAEEETDPTAEDLEPARTIEADADEMQAEIDAMAKELDEVEARLEDLAGRTLEAKAEVRANKADVVSAKESLLSLR